MQYVAFKWVHFETNTLVPYNDEIMFENSLMLNQTGSLRNFLDLKMFTC
jgi:hypothetical protein